MPPSSCGASWDCCEECRDCPSSVSSHEITVGRGEGHRSCGHGSARKEEEEEAEEAEAAEAASPQPASGGGKTRSKVRCFCSARRPAAPRCRRKLVCGVVSGGGCCDHVRNCQMTHSMYEYGEV